MAILEKVVIEVKGDTKLEPTIAKLEKMGKVDKNNAASFKKTSKEFQDSTKKSESLLKGLGKQALVLGTALVGAFAIKQIIGDAINILKEFEKELSTLQSITGSTAEQMEFFAKAAKEIGRATKTSATEVVKAFTLIGSAQPQLLKNQKALAAVTEQALILSKAAGIDAVQAADALTGAMNQFGASAKDAAKFTDIFATSQQKGSSFIIDTSEALINSGAAAAAAGISFETTNAAIQALASGAIRGARAGTALRGVLSKLSAQADDEINPSMVGLSKTLEVLEGRNLGLKEATKLVGEEGATGLLTLIKQRQLFDELDGSLNEAGNAMEQMRINTDNLDGSLDELSNAYEEFILSQEDGLPTLKLTVDAMTGLVRAMTDADNLIKEMKINVALLESGLGRELTLFEKGKIAISGFNDEQIKLIAQRKIAVKIIKELNEEREEETEVTEKSTAATRVAVSALKLLKKQISDLKKQLEEQALAGNLSEKTLIEYTKAVKKAEEANKLLTDAIADQNIELIKLIDPLQQRTDAEVESLETIGAAELKASESEAVRIDINKEKRQTAINAAIELEQQFFAILSNINEGKLTQIENERKAAIRAVEDKVTAGILAEDELAGERLKITKKFDEERARILTKQAKNDQAAAIIAAIINTAVAVTATLEIPVLAALIAVAGAAEIATIAAQPIPEFHRGKRAEYSNEEINAKVLRSEYVIPPTPSKKHSGELDAMLQDKFEHFVFMKYQMPIIKQYSKIEQAGFSDSAITRHQRKQTGLLAENNKLLRDLMPSMKRATHGWN